MTQPLHWLAHLGRLGRVDIHPGGAAASEWLLEALAIADGQRILELGCGNGQTLVRLASRHTVTIDAVELLPEMRRAAAGRLRIAGCRNVRLHAADFTVALPFADACFDRVYGESVVAFHEPERVDRLLAAVRRVLQPGGRFGIVEAFWAAGQDAAAIAAKNAAAMEDFGLLPASPLPWTIDDWQARLAAAGFVRIVATRLPEALPSPTPSAALRRSGLLSRALRSRAHWDPRVRRAEAEYRQRLVRHSAGGPQLEGWRLVAEREMDDA